MNSLIKEINTSLWRIKNKINNKTTKNLSSINTPHLNLQPEISSSKMSGIVATTTKISSGLPPKKYMDPTSPSISMDKLPVTEEELTSLPTKSLYLAKIPVNILKNPSSMPEILWRDSTTNYQISTTPSKSVIQKWSNLLYMDNTSEVYGLKMLQDFKK